MAEFKIRGKRVVVNHDGLIFVDGKATNLKQWKNGTQYSNQYGNEQKDLRGKKLTDALYLRGFLPRS